MTTLPDFIQNSDLTLGVELELQLIDLRTFNLAMESDDFLRRLTNASPPGEVKPEISLSMIELNSSVHTNYDSLLNELIQMKNTVVTEAARTHLGVCGGGTHPFRRWQEQRIFPNERFMTASEQYGFLAKQFTVFGQHIHVGCANGEDALYLCHAFARYLPQFVALSAASPFQQGVDTSFDCSRLTVISAFPLSGTPPWLLNWNEFVNYYEKMYEFGIVKSIKDFYWDIRPKPEYGTVEIRICDTPLTVERAADLAAYAQVLAAWLLNTRPSISPEIYLTYPHNRFNAARFGLDAIYIDPIKGEQIPLKEDILHTCKELIAYGHKIGASVALERIQTYLNDEENDARWIRKQNQQFQSLADTVKKQIELWSN